VGVNPGLNPGFGILRCGPRWEHKNLQYNRPQQQLFGLILELGHEGKCRPVASLEKAWEIGSKSFFYQKAFIAAAVAFRVTQYIM
jgi:hypothetical protein